MNRSIRHVNQPLAAFSTSCAAFHHWIFVDASSFCSVVTGSGWTAGRGSMLGIGHSFCRGHRWPTSRGPLLTSDPLLTTEFPIAAHVELDNLGLKNLFNCYGVVMDAYISNKARRRSGRNVNGCFDLDSSSSKTISQPIETAKSHLVYARKFDTQKTTSPSESSTNDEEEINSSFNILIAPNKLDMQVNTDQSRSQRKKMINAHEEPSCNVLQVSPTPTEIVKEVIELDKKIRVTIIGNKTPAIRGITRS
ncbi:hypothetical protein Cgig2_027162 [Carnegiea gigantea]|uniref:Uncharacterized protein n=1 Tax=Carnegiea gigantea TaxID=171969 RepID=A0A9Q1QR07_9CARY|nr:hypothetical protein Cgig2_027162 [Carnegiea gigantea]